MIYLTSVNSRLISPFCEGLIYVKLHKSRSFAKVKPPQKFLNLQYELAHGIIMIQIVLVKKMESFFESVITVFQGGISSGAELSFSIFCMCEHRRHWQDCTVVCCYKSLISGFIYCTAWGYPSKLKPFI